MPSSKFGSKFFGEERYQQYVNELTAEGTVGGEKLSPEERKEGFKKRNDKIRFQEFVGKVLNKKKSATTVTASKTALPGMGSGGALVKASRVSPGKIVPQKSGEETQQNLDEILKGIDSILNTLREEKKLKEKQEKDERQGAERRKRKKSEEKLESGIFKGLVKQTEKVLAPVKGLFEKIFDFIKTIILGRFLVKFIDWMSNKENQGKLEAIGKFLSKTWPALLAAYLLFGNSFGRFLTRIIAMSLKFIPRIAATIVRLAAAHPLAAAAIAGAGLFVAGAVIPKLMPGTVDEQERKTAEKPGTNAEKIKKLEEQKSKLNFLEKLQGKGAEIDEQIYFLQTGKTKAYSGGGLVQGFAGGGHALASGTDTVPAMLTPGEFVMSRGAVNKYGVGTLASMNAAGGGTNRPRTLGNTFYAAGGGEVQPAEANRQSAEKQPRVPADGAEKPGAPEKTTTTTPTPTPATPKTETKDTPLQLTGTAKAAVGSDTEFLNGLVAMSKRLGVNPSDLLAKMASESSLQPYAQNSKTLATGLIQMKPTTAASLGTSISALKGMTRAQQLPYIEKFLKPTFAKAKKPITAGHVYTATFLPAFINEPSDFVIASKDGSLPKGYGREPYYWYRDNDGLDLNKDNKIQIFELGQRIAQMKKDFGIGGGTIAGGATSGTTSGGGTGSTSQPAMSDEDQKKFLSSTFDYNAVRKHLGVKTSSISKPSRPSSTEAYQQTLNQSQPQTTPQGQPQGQQTPEKSDPVPVFDAAAMSSPKKIKTLGITV